MSCSGRKLYVIDGNSRKNCEKEDVKGMCHMQIYG